MHLHNEKSLKQVIEELMQSKPLRAPYQQIQLQSEWEGIMGKTISKYTEKIILKNNTLTIYTINSSLRNELQYLKDDIIQKVNQAIKGINIQKVIIK